MKAPRAKPPAATVNIAAVPSLSAADLAAHIERLEVERRDAAIELAAAEDAERASVLEASDDDLDRMAAQIVELRRRVARTDKRIEIAAERHKAATKAEAEATAAERRSEALAEAQALASEAQSWIKNTYSEHALAIRSGLVRVGEIKDRMEALGAKWPDLRLGDVEAFRIMPAAPGRTSTVDEIYYVDRDGAVLTAMQEADLRQDRTGQYFCGQAPVYARTRQAAVHHEGRPAASPQPLLDSVRLPRVFYADEDFWNAHSRHWPG